MASTRTLTVRKLLGQPRLGLTIVNEGDLDHRVRGAHSVEIEGPGRWLRPDWLMLTTGLRFVGLADAQEHQARLVAELVRCGAAALLFGVGVHFPEVPSGLRRAAATAGLNLLAVEPSVPFLRIEQFVYQTEMSADAYQLRQRLRIQEDLLEALATDLPVRSLVHRIGALLSGAAILYEESGRVVESTGQAPTVLIWSALRAGSLRGQVHRSFTIGRWQVAARPVALHGVGYWIAIGSRRGEVLDEFAQPVLDATQALLGALRGLRALTVAQSLAEAAEILRTVRGSMTPETAGRAWERLRPFRFERNRPVRAVTALFTGAAGRPNARSATSATSATERSDALLQLAQDFDLPLLLETDEAGGVTGLVGDRAVLDEWLGEVSRSHHVGLSEPFDDLHLTRARAQDAERALGLALRRRSDGVAAGATAADSGGSVLRFEDVDLATWLLASRSVDEITTKTRQQLGDLLDRDDLAATVVAYLNCDLDVRATAEAMFLHPNSVRYRLRRVEEIIGSPITSAAAVANLYLALHDRLAMVKPDLRTTDRQAGSATPATGIGR